MESIMSYGQFWLLYGAFSLLGLWCWSYVLFWLPRTSMRWQIWMVLGMVIVLTPSPIASDSSHFAPAIFVIVLDALSALPVAASPAWWWLAGSSVIGALVIVALRALTRNAALAEE